MGRYSVRNKQDLSGIATLTGNPIAVDNIRATLDKVAQDMASISGVPKSAFQPKK